MRIGIDCRSLQEPHPSGVSVYTGALVRALVLLPEASKHTFVLFFNGFRMGKSVVASRFQKELEAALAGEHGGTRGPCIEWRVRNMPNKLFSFGAMVFSRPSMRWMFGTVDVVCLPTLLFFPLRDRSVPIVTTFHDVSFERYPECLGMKGRWWHRALRPREFARRSQRMSTVSESTKADLVELYGCKSEKIQVAYPGIEHSTQPTSERQADSYTPEPRSPHTAGQRAAEPGTTAPRQDRSTILALCTLEPRKNLETLLDAFAIVRNDMPELELLIAGSVGWKSKHLLERIATEPNIRYVGYVDEATKQQLLANARVFVYPSLYEGFGFPPLEAQAHGVPVIVGYHSSLPEVLAQSAMYVDVLDVRSVATGMTHLLSEPSMWEYYSSEGLKNVARFSWNVTARQILSMLEAAAAKNTTNPMGA